MNPFFNLDQLKSYIENMQKPFLQGMPLKPEDIQKYVMESVNQFMPDFLRGGHQPSPQSRSEQDIQMFETHDFVIVRIPMRFDGSHRPRLSMDSFHLYVRELSESNEELKLRLPCPIKPKYAKADYKDGVLEVRMLKQGPEPMREINIDEMM